MDILNKCWFITKTISRVSCEFAKYYFHGSRLQMLRNIAMSLGDNILYVKLFQSLVGGVDTLTQEEVNFFNSYTDNVPWSAGDENTDFRDIIHKVNQNLKPHDQIHNIGHTPYKSGTMSLVYEATDGQDNPVVVKVLRKNIAQRLEEAYNDVAALISFIEYIPWCKIFNFSRILHTNKILLLRQTTLAIEAENLITMKNNFKHVDTVVIPSIYKSYTDESDQILVMERLYGQHLLELSDSVCEIYAQRIATFTMKCLFLDGVYHADLHAGNIIFMTDQSQESVHKIGIIDLGIVGNIPNDYQAEFMDFFKDAAIDKNYAKGADIIIEQFTIPNRADETLPISKTTVKKELTSALEQIIGNEQDIGHNELVLLNTTLTKYGMQLNDVFLRGELAIASAAGVARILAKKAGRTYFSVLIEVVRYILEPFMIED